MRTVFAIATLAFMAFACNLCNLSSNVNKGVTNSNNSSTKPTPAATPAKASLKDSLPKTVGDFTLDNTYEKSELKGDDKFLPGAEDVLGAVYKSSANKKEQVMVGSYASAADAETARAKRLSTSKYLARWTKGNLLFVSTDMYFKDKL